MLLVLDFLTTYALFFSIQKFLTFQQKISDPMRNVLKISPHSCCSYVLVVGFDVCPVVIFKSSVIHFCLLNVTDYKVKVTLVNVCRSAFMVFSLYQNFL